MSYYRGNWDLTCKNHKALKIVEIVIHYLSILCFSLQAKFLVEKFSLKYSLNDVLSQKTFWLIFIFAIFTFFLYFFALGHWLPSRGGVGGRDGGGQNLGLWVEKREGGLREAEKRAGRKS